MNAVRIAALLLVLAAGGECIAAEAALPSAVTREFAGLKLAGRARLQKLWMHVYDATLWTESGRAPGEAPFALELRYAMRFSGEDIAERSVEEIRRLRPQFAPRLADWGRAMRRIFPDVRDGDALVGVAIPGREARFYEGERLLGTIADGAFVDAFFGIWLDERTSEPGLRRELLGSAQR